MVRVKNIYLLFRRVILKKKMKNDIIKFNPHSWMHLVESSNMEPSGASGVPQSCDKYFF